MEEYLKSHVIYQIYLYSCQRIVPHNVDLMKKFSMSWDSKHNQKELEANLCFLLVYVFFFFVQWSQIILVPDKVAQALPQYKVIETETFLKLTPNQFVFF